MKDEQHLAGFTFLNEGVLMKKSLFITGSICFALGLGTASAVQAQTTYPVNGTAGFDTGLQRVANLVLDHVIHLGDANPLGAVIHWGDNSLTNPGLLHCPVTPGNSFPNYDHCDVYGTHRYASAGTYTITIEYDDPPSFPFIGNGPRHSVTTSAAISPISDYVIVSIGDSIASGEGSPVVANSIQNYPVWGFWDDPYSNGPKYIGGNPLFPNDELVEWPNQSFPCHRSALAGPAQAAQLVQQNNPGVTFTHYACSGAKIGPTDTANNKVQDAINQLRIVRQRVPRIDVLIVSAGANSLSDGSDCTHKSTFGCGFGSLFEYCLINVVNPCSANQQFQDDFTASLNKLPGEYMNLAKEINCVNPADGTPEPSCTDPQKQIPKLVLITEYMDPTHDQNGKYPVLDYNVFPARIDCPAFPTVSQGDWQFFHDFLVHRLNGQVDGFPAYARQAGLSVPTYVVGIEQDFLMHGLCAGNPRWVLTLDDSLSDLGSIEPPVLPPVGPAGTHGSGHPNHSGQADYRDRIYNTIVQNSYAITMASATAGGAPYAFGTWTNKDVVVTLTASNPISEAGIKQTIYGVDNSRCQPVTWPDCSTYSSPFTISTSGKHTVTSSSFNASGLLGPFQTVQVWVDKEPPIITVSGELLRMNHEEEEQKLVRIEIWGSITDSLSGVDASSAAYTVEDGEGVLQAGGPLTLAPDGTYSLVVSFKRTHHREDADQDEHERDRDRKGYQITVSAKANAGTLGSASTFAEREKHRGDEDQGKHDENGNHNKDRK